MTYIFNPRYIGNNELLFYTDNYVLISKDNTEVKSMSDLRGVTIGALETDLNKIKASFDDSDQIIYNSFYGFVI